VSTLSIGSLFSGIGGLELGLERSGLGRVVWQVEKDAYCRTVLAQHWPEVERYEDVREFHPPGSVDVLCGGFPCQPWSVAGKQLGAADERHLWPEFARIIDEAQPTIVVGENVPGLRTRGLRPVLLDLAALGFDVEWTDIRASDVGAPHRRERLFIIAIRGQGALEPGWLGSACAGVLADPDCAREQQPKGISHGRRRWTRHRGEEGNGSQLAHANGAGLEVGRKQHARPERATPQRGGPSRDAWAVEPDVGRVAHGVPSRVDRLRCLGNAVVPQVAEVIGRAILAAIAAAA
jgi:DNA (cytosine-5)-methyltransferase 1